MRDRKVDASGKMASLTTVEGERADDLLVPVFENGVVLRRFTLDEVRQRAAREFL